MACGIFAWVYAKLLHSCLTLCDPTDYSPSGSSVHGILQARILQWVAVPSSRGSSWPRDWACVSYISCIACSLPLVPPGAWQDAESCPLQWKSRVLTTGPPGKPPIPSFYTSTYNVNINWELIYLYSEKLNITFHFQNTLKSTGQKS